MPTRIIIPDKWVKEFDKFVFKLDKPTRAKLVRNMDLLESRGPLLPLPFVKKIDNLIWELRIKGFKEIRVLYTIKEGDVHVLNWFVKKSQKTPVSQLEKAIKRLRKI